MATSPSPQPQPLGGGAKFTLLAGAVAGGLLLVYAVAPGLFGGAPAHPAKPAAAAPAPAALSADAIVQQTQAVVDVEIAKFDRNGDHAVDGRDWTKLTADQKQECALFVVHGFQNVVAQMNGQPANSDESRDYLLALRKTADAAVPVLDGAYGSPANATAGVVPLLWQLQLAAQLQK